MSYDIDIRSKHFCPACGRDSTREDDSYSGELPNPTYNLTPKLREEVERLKRQSPYRGAHMRAN
jgi:hypothetical protein